ncbi:MAG: cupin domain-containing protein [Myxococcota bacterium]
MARTLDLTRTFLHVRDGGDLDPIEVGPGFFRESIAERTYDRVAGVFAFETGDDLHSSLQEVHPQADELLFLLEGAIDVVIDGEDGRETVSLEAGHALVVPRGRWHHLIVRAPGRFFFLNSRTGMQSRKA